MPAVSLSSAGGTRHCRLPWPTSRRDPITASGSTQFGGEQHSLMLIAHLARLHAARKARAVQSRTSSTRKAAAPPNGHQRWTVREVGERRTVLPHIDGGEPTSRREDPVPHNVPSRLN